MSATDIEHFEALIEQRMRRFQILLDKAQFGFKQYQYDGVEWCVRNELRPRPIENIRGGIIADEMGLGKTIMMIGTMFVNCLSRTLIVVPPVLIQQWHSEILKTSGHSALMYYGETKKTLNIDTLRNAPVVITTYNSIIMKNCILKNIVWNRIIYDEAHHLRNAETRRYSACSELKARIRWLVTGTPIQNRKKDFHNLCRAIGMRKSYYDCDSNLKSIVSNFVLRRTKADVGIKLPPVTTSEIIVKWKSDEERMLAEELHAVLPNQTGVSETKSGLFAENIFEKGKTLLAMMRTKQCCILPTLLTNTVNEYIEEGIIGDEYINCTEHTTSKIDAVSEVLLSRYHNGNGKIVFCHFQAEIDAIAQRLESGGMKKVVKYDGRNSGGKTLQNLADPADALIIQIQTGCEGLNLQKNFSELYFVSPHWNPFIEDQAVARCHRIGQEKPVSVFNFRMQGFEEDEEQEMPSVSLEKYVSDVQSSKRVVSRTILMICDDEPVRILDDPDIIIRV